MQKQRGFFSVCSVVSHAITVWIILCFIFPSPWILVKLFLSKKEKTDTRSMCAVKQIKTSRSQSAMFNFNLFLVIVQTCAKMFCKMRVGKKKESTDTLSQINYDSTFPDHFPESNLRGFEIRLLSVHTNCRQPGINVWFQIFLTQLVTAIKCFYFFLRLCSDFRQGLFWSS